MSAIAELKRLPENKAQVESFVSQAISEIESGECNPLAVAINIKAIQEALKEINETLKDYAYEEAAKYGEREFDYHGAKIKMQMTGVRYNYKDCGDSEWQQAVDKKKEREVFLKTITPKMEVYGADGSQILPPVKTGLESAVITLK